MNLFERKDATVMLIKQESAPFDDDNYIYELKLDGVRCLAYINHKSVEFRNKRNLRLNKKFPELTNIYQNIKEKNPNYNYILDGELHIFQNGNNNFFEVSNRTILTNPFKIKLHSKQFPATFTAFDILYYQDREVMNLPLIQRKELLKQLIDENERINYSRYIETNGTALFEKTGKFGLEGIVAKEKNSVYIQGKRSNAWIKCKHLLEDDFIVVGYISKENHVVSLVLAQINHNEDLIYKGKVTASKTVLSQAKEHRGNTHLSFPHTEEITWLAPPYIVVVVRYMELTLEGYMRQPAFKCIRTDKEWKDCRTHD